MTSITIEEISKDLRAYVQRVQAGESFVILQEGTPVAEVVPASSSSAGEVTSEKTVGFVEALEKFQEQVRAEGIDVDLDDVFETVRDRTPAPDEARW